MKISTMVIRVLLVSSTHRSRAKAGGPVAVCKAQRIAPAIIGQPEILIIFSSSGCSVGYREPTGHIPEVICQRLGSVSVKRFTFAEFLLMLGTTHMSPGPRCVRHIYSA